MLIDLSTGSINRMGIFNEENEYIGNFRDDTCLNNKSTDKSCTSLLLPTHSNSFWLVLSQHELEAMDLEKSIYIPLILY